MSNKKKILFERKSYIILIISICFISVGYLLMSGGGSKNPSIFNTEIYNFQRIRLAPTFVIFGFVLALFSIIHKKK